MGDHFSSEAVKNTGSPLRLPKYVQMERELLFSNSPTRLLEGARI